jgi:MinD-like ATPase involved in chromosome partitioning or flagellar assembly
MSTQLTSLRGQGARTPGTPPSAPEHQVVLLASGRSGQGTTTLAALLGIVAAVEGTRVLLVDAGEGELSLSTLLGVDPQQLPAGERAGSALLEERVLAISDTLSLLSVAPAAADEQPSAGERRALLHWLAPIYSRFDLVVVDAGSRLDSILALCGSPVAKLLAVTTGERIAITATYALVKVLETRIPALPLEVLLNTATAPSAVAAFRELESASQLFLQRAIEYAGAIPDDPGLRAGLLAGMPVQQAAIDSPVVTAVHQLGARLRRELHQSSHAVIEPRFSHWR